jgi:hypothetical protein
MIEIPQGGTGVVALYDIGAYDPFAPGAWMINDHYGNVLASGQLNSSNNGWTVAGTIVPGPPIVSPTVTVPSNAVPQTVTLTASTTTITPTALYQGQFNVVGSVSPSPPTGPGLPLHCG